MKTYWVYILCSKERGTLYIGVTSNLARRMYEHREKLKAGFTANYDVTMLVHAEAFQDVNDALRREKCIKTWKREWKIRLIEEHNPLWRNLYADIL